MAGAVPDARSVAGTPADARSAAGATADALCAAGAGAGLGSVAAWSAPAGPVPIAVSPIDAVVETSVGVDAGRRPGCAVARSCCPVACDAIPLLSSA